MDAVTVLDESALAAATVLRGPGGVLAVVRYTDSGLRVAGAGARLAGRLGVPLTVAVLLPPYPWGFVFLPVQPTLHLADFERAVAADLAELLGVTGVRWSARMVGHLTDVPAIVGRTEADAVLLGVRAGGVRHPLARWRDRREAAWVGWRTRRARSTATVWALDHATGRATSF